jgi:SAM-dependent methyltransferase
MIARIKGMVFEDRARAGSFGDDAEKYDRSRPGYPSALFDDLVPAPCEAVDVGCGTGIVAVDLIARGCTVIGVEPDARMARIAAAKGVEVSVTTFEQWDPENRRFDIVTCGQAWHWVDPARGADKVATVLRPGGRFGLFWNSLRHTDDVAAGFERIYARLAPNLLNDSVALGTLRTSGRSDDPAFVATGDFRRLEQRSYRWHRRYTTETWLDELPTHSDHHMLPGATLERILDEVRALIDGLGGEIVVEYTTAGLFGRRR